jgi:hypothetical protein
VRVAILIALFVLSASTANAQTHPCSLPDQTVATKGTKVGWCVPVDDLQGVTWRLKISGNVVVTIPAGALAPIGGPDTTGLYYLEANLPAGYSKGLYPVVIYGQNVEGIGPESDPKMWQIGGPAGKPVKPRITGGTGE